MFAETRDGCRCIRRFYILPSQMRPLVDGDQYERPKWRHIGIVRACCYLRTRKTVSQRVRDMDGLCSLGARECSLPQIGNGRDLAGSRHRSSFFFSVEENGTLTKKKKDAQVVGGIVWTRSHVWPMLSCPNHIRRSTIDNGKIALTSPHIESTHGVSWKCLSRLPGCDMKP